MLKMLKMHLTLGWFLTEDLLFSHHLSEQTCWMMTQIRKHGQKQTGPELFGLFLPFADFLMLLGWMGAAAMATLIHPHGLKMLQTRHGAAS